MISDAKANADHLITVDWNELHSCFNQIGAIVKENHLDFLYH